MHITEYDIATGEPLAVHRGNFSIADFPTTATTGFIKGDYPPGLFVITDGVASKLPPKVETAKEKEARLYDEAKTARAEAVSKIVVTVTRADGTELKFDGDEAAQARLDRFGRGAVARGLTEVPWKMSDNSVRMVTPAEMAEAYLLSGEAQGALWFI